MDFPGTIKTQIICAYNTINLLPSIDGTVHQFLTKLYVFCLMPPILRYARRDFNGIVQKCSQNKVNEKTLAEHNSPFISHGARHTPNGIARNKNQISIQLELRLMKQTLNIDWLLLVFPSLIAMRRVCASVSSNWISPFFLHKTYAAFIVLFYWIELYCFILCGTCVLLPSRLV